MVIPRSGSSSIFRCLINADRLHTPSQLLDCSNPIEELHGSRGQLVRMLMARSAQARPGVRHVTGELGIAKKCRKAEQLRLGRTELHAQCSPSPQFIQRGFEGLARQKSGCARPNAGRRRIWALEKIARGTDQLRLVDTHDNSRTLAASFSVSWIISFRSPATAVCAPSLHCLNTSPAQGPN